MTPGYIQLLLPKQQIGPNSNRPQIVGDTCAAIAASADSPLLDLLDAKFKESENSLTADPQNPARARKLLEGIFAEDPARETVSQLLKSAFP